ncbi:MAG: ATP-binding protein [Dehalococcoidia bacterium]|nr:ATP-binding protein [Dehalococcoidia bacterium]
MAPVSNLARADADRLAESLGRLPEPTVDPPFVVVSGLPGSGKSHFCRQLALRRPFVVLESDVLRRVLFPTPRHSAAENARLFGAIRVLIADLLGRGEPVILDATNLSEHHRELLYHIADMTGSRLILIRVEAPVGIIKERLEGRAHGVDPEDRSDADWEVYRKMEPAVEPIRRRHLVVDTSRDIRPMIEKVIRESRL